MCQCIKSLKRNPAGELLPLLIPDQLFSHIMMNFITDLSVSIKELDTPPFNVILVIVNHFTKIAHYTVTHKFITSFRFAELLLRDIIRLHNVLKQIVSD